MRALRPLPVTALPALVVVAAAAGAAKPLPASMLPLLLQQPAGLLLRDIRNLWMRQGVLLLRLHP